MIKRREFITFLLLTILTCGIYLYYHMYQMTKDLNQMAGDDGCYTDPAMVVLLNFITCGIYSLYWFYRQGERMKRLADANSIYCPENGTTYLIFAAIGYFLFGILIFVAHYLMIKNFNALADGYNEHIR